MAQHDYDIANANGSSFRTDLNNCLDAVQSTNSGSSAPSGLVAGMLWFDTSSGILKCRNAANTAWDNVVINGAGNNSGELLLQSAFPNVRFRDTDLAVNAGGLWFVNCANGGFQVLKNTAAGGDFSTFDTVINSDGSTCTLRGRVDVGGATAAGGDVASIGNSTARGVSNPYFYWKAPSSGSLELYGYDGTTVGVGAVIVNVPTFSVSGSLQLAASAPKLIHNTGGQNVGEMAFAVANSRGSLKVTTRTTAGASAIDVLETEYSTQGTTVLRSTATTNPGYAAVGGGFVDIDGGIAASGAIRFWNCLNVHPATDNAVTCGKSGGRWSAVWAANGTIQTSDRRLKTDLRPIDPSAASRFVASLSPTLYRWIDGGGGRPGKRTHAGLIAQDVRVGLECIGIDDCGLWVKDLDKPDGTESLRYDQMVPFLVGALQDALARIAVLEQRAAA